MSKVAETFRDLNMEKRTWPFDSEALIYLFTHCVTLGKSLGFSEPQLLNRIMEINHLICS